MSVISNDPKLIKPPSTVPRVRFNISATEYEIVKQVASESFSYMLIEDEDDWDITWTDFSVPTEKLSKMKYFQKINHFPGMHGICKKNFLAWNLNKLLKLHPSAYNFFPKTWVLPGDYSEFKSYANKSKVFIVKPEASSQGRGIFLIKNIEDINLSERYVVQEYMQNPFLIDGLKFDLRLYVLVTGCNPLRIYLHEEGLTRLATEAYSQAKQENFSEVYMHLTNYAINKNNPKFRVDDIGEISSGHKRSLTSTYKYLLSLGKDVKTIKVDIEEMIIKTLCAVQPSLSHIYKSCQPEDCSGSLCFELLGFDIIFDQDLKPLLLEVNHSPSFTTDSKLDYKIKRKLIEDTLGLVGVKSRRKKPVVKCKKVETKRVIINLREKSEEKSKKIMKELEKKDFWENSHLGGFKRIYPLDNSAKFEEFLESARNIWAEVSGHRPRKSTKDANKSNPAIKSTLKSKSLVPKKRPNLSNTLLQKSSYFSSNNMQGEDALCDSEYDNVRQFIESNKIPLGYFNEKDLAYYRQINEILKEKRHSLSFLRGTEFHLAVMKMMKPAEKIREMHAGAFVVPKIFDFTTKTASHIPESRRNRNSNQLHLSAF